MGRAAAFGALGGAVLAGLVASVDVVRALSDPQFRAWYGTWTGLLVAVPVGALVGLVCSLVAVVVYLLSVRTTKQLPLRLLTSLGAATPVVLLGAIRASTSALVTCFGLGSFAFGFAFLTFSLIATNRSPAPHETAAVSS